MLFRQLFDPRTSSPTSLVADPRTREALLIDPVREQVDRDLQVLEELGLSLCYVLETRLHAGHVTGAGLLRACTGARVVCGPRGASCADVHLGPGAVLRLGELEVEVLETPEATPGEVCYRVGGRLVSPAPLPVRAAEQPDAGAEALRVNRSCGLLLGPPLAH